MSPPSLQEPSNQAKFLTFPLSDRQQQLITDDLCLQHLQDYFPQKTITIRSIHHGNEDLCTLITRELSTPVMDEIEEYLHFISPLDFTRVNPLHKYRMKKIEVVITEDPGLHLVWYYDNMFIKPIPPFLLNFTTWVDFLLPPRAAQGNILDSNASGLSSGAIYPVTSLRSECRAALGFLRTYAFLIQHYSDFEIAQSIGLIPREINYSDFRTFIVPFSSIPNETVSNRYRFGQMRLTRLNWAVRLLQPRSVSTGGWLANRLYYFELYTQSSDYSRSWLPPLAFAFAVLSLILSAMQVMLAVLASNTWESFIYTSWGFSIVTIIFCVIAGIILLSYVPLMLMGQIIYVMRRKVRQLE